MMLNPFRGDRESTATHGFHRGCLFLAERWLTAHPV